MISKHPAELAETIAEYLSEVGNSDDNVHYYAIARLVEIAKDHLDLFLPYAHSPSNSLRANFITIMEQLDREESYLALLAALNDAYQPIREKAIVGLKNWQDPRTIEPLRKALTDRQSSTTRRWAVSILGDLGDKESLPFIYQVRKDKDEWVRFHVGVAMLKLGDERGFGILERLKEKTLDPSIKSCIGQELSIRKTTTAEHN